MIFMCGAFVQSDQRTVSYATRIRYVVDSTGRSKDAMHFSQRTERAGAATHPQQANEDGNQRRPSTTRLLTHISR